jgi:hypothetical protein
MQLQLAEDEQVRYLTLFPYIVSSLGHLYHAETGKVVRGSNHKGYRRVALRCNTSSIRLYVHVIVATAFLGHAPSTRGWVVNHKDGDKTNNTLANLEWATVSENNKHACDTGLNPPMNGERNGRSKLDKSTVHLIRAHQGALSSAETAKKFGLGESTVRDIWTRRRWKHVESGLSASDGYNDPSALS